MRRSPPLTSRLLLSNLKLAQHPLRFAGEQGQRKYAEFFEQFNAAMHK